MQVGGSGTVKSEINVTPLVDVVLVLLIIFMVITPVVQMGCSALYHPASALVRLRLHPRLQGEHLAREVERACDQAR